MTFLFDIGRVLLDFEFEPSLSRLLPAGAPDLPERLRILLARKDEFESGRLDVASFTGWALQVLGTDATPDEFHHAWRHIFTPNEPMWKRVRQLHAAGHRLLLFSNVSGIHVPWIYGEFPEFSLFEGGVMSFQTGFVKPDPEIYHLAIRQHGLVPAETLYIDDLPENIATGRQLGFQCWQYQLHDHDAFEQWLGNFPV